VAEFQAGIVAQYPFIIPVKSGLQFAQGVDVNDGRAVNPAATGGYPDGFSGWR